jgi:hypothetical protein
MRIQNWLRQETGVNVRDYEAFVPAVILDRNAEIWFHACVVTDGIPDAGCVRGRARSAR